MLLEKPRAILDKESPKSQIELGIDSCQQFQEARALDLSENTFAIIFNIIH